ncbi:MAG: AtpZ/AtpI family protein [Acetobacter sp.]|nr:AtpZ/AtpI family protein [Acetobacter sp.]
MSSQIPDDIKDMEKRIKALKQQYVNDDTEEKNVSGVFKGLRLGLEFASGTFVGAAIGYMLDEVFDFQFILLLIFTILGGLAGMLNAYRYIKNLEK